MTTDIKKYLLSVCVVLFTGATFTACDDLVEVDLPGHRMVSESVFENEQTAIAALNGIYYELFNKGYSSGDSYSITYLCGLASDELAQRTSSYEHGRGFWENYITPDNQGAYWIWTGAYETIYMVNSLLEGLEESESLTPELKDRLEGEAKFIRAFAYFYLVNLYGETPLLLTTDYEYNALAERDSVAKVYDQILMDLEESTLLLDEAYLDGERTQVNRFVALALMARVHLYLENWELAEDYSSQVIAATGTYSIVDDVNQVFLANSREAIWQISPYGSGYESTQTNEGYIFNLDPINFLATLLTPVSLTDYVANDFSQDDLRFQNWIGYNPNLELYFPYKYKVYMSTDPIQEYSMVMRLAEQYLIRSEARARQGNLQSALADLDVIRERAGLSLLADTAPGISQEGLFEAILLERRRELFTEWGHRWLDLKRTGRATEVLAPIKEDWDATDVLFPVPGNERMKNPNLTQNDGY